MTRTKKLPCVFPGLVSVLLVYGKYILNARALIPFIQNRTILKKEN